ncbi:MAG: hypothetical protein KQH63_09635 [Desulfobulbaceae bacterium]|nr:hypothetical protein [Desulfobulbaceae bacterium]
MKTILKITAHLLLISLVLPTLVLAADNPWDQKLPFKKATINYTVSGSGSGTETLYIRNYGKEQAKYRKTTQKVMFMNVTTDDIEITTPDWIYTIDMKEKSGTKAANPVKYMIKEYNNLSSKEKKMVRKNAEEMGTSALKGMEGQVRQNAEKILGYNCDLAEVAGSTVYSIHGTSIPLKSQTNMMGMNFSTVATKIDKGSVPDHVFTPPQGITITHDPQSDEQARMMAKRTLDILKSPDAAQEMQNQAGSAMEQQNAYQPPASAPAQQGGQSGQNQGNMGEEMNKAMDALKGLFGN